MLGKQTCQDQRARENHTRELTSSRRSSGWISWGRRSLDGRLTVLGLQQHSSRHSVEGAQAMLQRGKVGGCWTERDSQKARRGMGRQWLTDDGDGVVSDQVRHRLIGGGGVT
jgi:hypothetical protein